MTWALRFFPTQGRANPTLKPRQDAPAGSSGAKSNCMLVPAAEKYSLMAVGGGLIVPVLGL